MKASVLLREIFGNIVFVDGEVARPGVYTTKSRVTAQQAIALAGGTKETAEQRTALVASKAPDGNFISRTTNLTKLTSGTDFALQPNGLGHASWCAKYSLRLWCG